MDERSRFYNRVLRDHLNGDDMSPDKTDHERILLLESTDRSYKQDLQSIYKCLQNIDTTLKDNLQRQQVICKNQIASCTVERAARIERYGERFSKRPTWQDILIILALIIGLNGSALGFVWHNLSNDINEVKAMIKSPAVVIEQTLNKAPDPDINIPNS